MASHKDPYVTLRLFSSGLNVVLITASIWLTSAIEKSVSSLLGDKPIVITTLLYAGPATLIWVLVTFVLAPVMLKWWPIRRILLSGSYVEGCWIEVVSLTDGTVGTATITIQPDGESFNLFGTTYSKEGGALSSFVADYHDIQWPRLRYKHSNWPYLGQDGEGVLEGIAQLSFESSPRGPPVYYAGFFHHAGSNVRNRTQAYKIKRKEIWKLNSVDSKIEMMQEYKTRLLSGAGS